MEKIDEILRQTFIETPVEVYRQLLNDYALENIAVGRLKPNDEIPFERFERELQPYLNAPDGYKDSIKGDVITSDGRVADMSMRKFVRKFFVDRMNEMFERVPYYKPYPGHVGLYYFRYGLTEYLENVYQIFVEALNTQVEHKFEECKQSKDFCFFYNFSFEYVSRFLTRLLTTGIRPHSKINFYWNNILYPSPFVEMLITADDETFTMRNYDKDDVQVQLAVISSIRCLNLDHLRLLNKKLIAWANQQHK